MWGYSKVISMLSPVAYQKYEYAQESSYTGKIKTIIQRILIAENQETATYYRRVQGMINDLPNTCETKSIESVIHLRLKVITSNKQFLPISNAGIDIDSPTCIGKLYIILQSNLEKNEGFEAALPWICAKQIFHLLEMDAIERAGIKLIACIFITFIVTCFLNWSLPTSLLSVMLANSVAHVTWSYRMENKAEKFVKKYCTQEEQLQAKLFFEKMRHSKLKIGLALLAA